MIVGYKLVNEADETDYKKVPKPFIGCSLPKIRVNHKNGDATWHRMYFKVDTWYQKKGNGVLNTSSLCTAEGFHYFSSLNSIIESNVDDCGYGMDEKDYRNAAVWRILIDEDYGYYKGHGKSICRRFKFVKKVCSAYEIIYHYFKFLEKEEKELENERMQIM